MVRKSITKAELFDMVFKDTIRTELRYRVTKDGQLELLVTLVPKKGRAKTIAWPITKLSVGTHPLLAIDEIKKGKLGKLMPKELTINFGIVSAKWKI